jgi:hypothetical protein
MTTRQAWKTCYNKGRARLIDQDLEPVRDVKHNLPFASIVEMLKFIDHHHACSCFPHQDPQSPRLFVFPYLARSPVR